MKRCCLWLGALCSASAAWSAPAPAPYPTQVCTAHDLVTVLDNRGAIWSWGGSTGNSDGRMGLGDDAELNFLNGVNSSSGGWHFGAQKVADGFSSVSCGEHHSAAIARNGTLWAWGYGMIGDGSGETRDTGAHYRPVAIGSGYRQVAAGYDYTLALKIDGSLWAWGDNQYGQLGDGSKTNRARPVQIGHGYARIAAGMSHSAALKDDGTLWIWGSNNRGQAGLGAPGSDGVATEYLRPVQVGADFIAVAVGDTYTAAVKRNGDLLAWGHQRHGFGRGVEEDGSPTPQQIGAGFVDVVMDSSHTLGLKNDTSVWEWGYRTKGARNLTPVSIGDGYIFIAAGGYQSAAIRRDRTLWVWGGSNWSYLVEHGYDHDAQDRWHAADPARVAFPLAEK